MLYIIKSVKWTDNYQTNHYQKTRYWGPKQCGYTYRIAEAGRYEEDEAQEILRRSGSNSVELIPITESLIHESLYELNQWMKEISNTIIVEEHRHEGIIYELHTKLENIAKLSDTMYSLLNMLKSNEGDI